MAHLNTRSPTRFVLRTGDTWRDPYPMYRGLRDADPVHHVADGDFWFLSRFTDVFDAARDPATFSSARGLTVEPDQPGADMGDATPIVFLDPPEHTAFRRLVGSGFTPRQVTELEDDVRAFVAARLDNLVEGGGGDIVAELFKPLPSFVVAHYLGVPAEDRPRFDVWTDQIVAAATQGGTDTATDGIADLLGYFGELIERRRSQPGDDMVSHLVGLGEDEVSTMWVLGFAFTMVAGGNDTTTGLLGGAVQLLAADPAQRTRLTSGEVPVEVALEELLRLTSPVQGLARTSTRDVELHGVEVPAGRKVLLLYAAGNRDPERYGPDADSLDVGRRPSQILTFSQGSHHCLGAAAARLQGRVALEELLAAYPDFEVDPAGVRWAPGPYVRRPASVPFVGRP